MHDNAVHDNAVNDNAVIHSVFVHSVVVHSVVVHRFVVHSVVVHRVVNHRVVVHRTRNLILQHASVRASRCVRVYVRDARTHAREQPLADFGWHCVAFCGILRKNTQKSSFTVATSHQTVEHTIPHHTNHNQRCAEMFPQHGGTSPHSSARTICLNVC